MSLLAAETDFALNLLRQTPAAESTVFSPLSIAIALSVLFSGAKDKTKSEIGDAILRGAKPSKLEAFYGSAVESMKHLNNAEVDIATRSVEPSLSYLSRFFLNDGYEILDAYRDNIQKKYNTDAKTLNFAKNIEAAKTVNGFVNATTRGKISELVTPDMFPDAVAFLINAIYFNAKWEQRFDDSHKQSFFSSEKKSREVDMMSLSDQVYFPYGENDRLRVLRLPYKNADFEMAVFLPKKRFGLEAIRSKISGKELQDLISKAESQEMSIRLPKFHLETSLQLTETLKKLGIVHAFSDAADFSLVSKKGVKVSDVIHKAVITVDEEGTVAAAATAVRIMFLSASFPGPIEFHADEPFLYSILYKNRPLFFGQYV